MQSSLNNVLLKIFARGFYQVHAPILLFGFFIMIGAVPGDMLVSYHRSLMLGMAGSPGMLAVVGAGWLLYTFKSWHYIIGQFFAADKQFLFYSCTSFSKADQIKSWCYVQAAVLMPVVIYALLAAGVGIAHRLYLQPVIILVFLTGVIYCSALLYVAVVNRSVDGSNQSALLRLSSKWRKPYFSLFIYHVFDKLKVPYFITKALSWLIITAVFFLFADVRNDLRVAGIAILAVTTAHTVLVFEERRFEETRLGFSRNLPYSRVRLFLNFAGVYLILLLPEGIWLFSRFAPLMAAELLCFALSVMLLFHALLQWMGLNMDKYLQWVLGLFIILFWIVMFKLLAVPILLNLLVAFMLFYRNYYGGKAQPETT